MSSFGGNEAVELKRWKTLSQHTTSPSKSVYLLMLPHDFVIADIGVPDCENSH